MGTKFEFTKIKEMQRKVQVTFDKSLSDPRLIKNLGKFSVDRIRKVTRTGKSMVTGQRLKPLSPATKKIKESLKRFNSPSQFYRKGKSNLTFTGQLLDSLKDKLLKNRRGFEVKPTGIHKAVKGKDGKVLTPRQSNEKVAAQVAKDGRPFLGLDDKAVDQLKRIAVRELRKSLRGAGLKK